MSEAAVTERPARRILGLHPNVFFLGLVSLLMDSGSKMIFTLVPLFLANVLGTGATVVGLVGGLSDSADTLLRVASGWFSDKVGKRKFLATSGYGLSALVTPFMYLAASWGAVLGIRFGDRLGKGIRTAARDALVADSISARERGRGFGLHKAMDTVGAVIGLVLAALIIYYVQGGAMQLSLKSFQYLVIVGTVPSVLAVLVLVFLVREVRVPRAAATPGRAAISLRGIMTGLDARFALFMVMVGLFTLGNSSDFFVVLRAQDLGVPLVQVVMMLVLFNVSTAIVSFPMGVLSDRLGRKRVIATGWGIYALSYLGFAIAGSIWQIWLLFAFYGAYYGTVQGVARAFIADLVVVPEKRGTAYGLYYGVEGLILLPASVIAGWLWEAVSPAATFYFGAGLAFLAMLGMVRLVRE